MLVFSFTGWKFFLGFPFLVIQTRIFHFHLLRILRMPIWVCEISAFGWFVGHVRWPSLTIPEKFLLIVARLNLSLSLQYDVFSFERILIYHVRWRHFFSRWVGNLLPEFVVLFFSLSFLEIYWTRLKSFFTLLRYLCFISIDRVDFWTWSMNSFYNQTEFIRRL